MPTKQRLRRGYMIVSGILMMGLLGWMTFWNRFAIRSPLTPAYHGALAVVRPYFTRITHVSDTVVWTRVSSSITPTGAPWHRDWLIIITGQARNPWHIAPLTIEVFVNGQQGGIDGWFIPLPTPRS